MAAKQTTTTRRAGEGRGRSTAADARRRLLSGIPIAERRLELVGVSTTVLEGGAGPPVVLLHGPGANATHFASVIPDLVTAHRVIVPDLPGHGASEVRDGEPTSGRVLAWLGELIEHTCEASPALVGHAFGGAIAVRFAVDRPRRVGRIVLVDSLGLTAFEPAPEFGGALGAFLAEPNERTHDAIWRHCALDLDRLRERMGERWESFEAYNLDRARTPSLQAAQGALMRQFGLPAIPAEQFERIVAPTTLIWGRHDLATRLDVAEAASARYGWPLEVIEECADDPPVEQPEAFLAALRTALDGRRTA
jgi:pimeloyl-ACP methyl ester carboxylesterase